MRVSGAHPIACLAEFKEIAPRIAIVDDFKENEHGVARGKQVEDVLVRTGSLDASQVQNFHNAYTTDVSLQEVLESEPAELLQKLDDYTEQSVLGMYGATTANLNAILDEHGTIRVVNQSQGQSPAGLVEPFIDQILEDEDFRKNLRGSLALKPRSHKSTVAQGLVNHLNGVWNASPGIASARQQYLQSAERAHSQGVFHVVTAGNLGNLAARCDKLGIEMPENSYKSILSNEFTTVVGATDTRGTLSLRDDRVAEWSSVNAGTEFSMPGVMVGIPGEREYTDGAAVSVPQVSALVDDMISASPALSINDVETLLYQASVPVLGSVAQVGAGQVDPDRALDLARHTAHLVAMNAPEQPEAPAQSHDGRDLGHVYA